MRIVLALEGPRDAAARIEQALAARGHEVAMVHPPVVELDAPAALVVADVDLAASTKLVDRLATRTPGVEFVLVGDRDKVAHPDVIEQLEHPLDLERLLAIVDELADVLHREHLRDPTDLVAYDTLFAGESTAIRELVRRTRLVARSTAPVWIFGEDGSGRSVVARAIHDRSSRRDQPFITINCGAHSDEELSRRLFHGDAAATAHARGGSLFIERVAMAGPVTQRELARYLETKHDDPASPRLFVGIQRDKALGGAQHFFSPELFYRLKVLEVEIPAVKDRGDDLEAIATRILERLVINGDRPRLAPETLRLLARYSFPGNLLELAHALTHAYVLARGQVIEPAHLPISIRKGAADPAHASALDRDLESLDTVAKRFEREYLLRVLRSVDGNRGRAAEVLGLSRKGLWGKLKAHGISAEDIDSEDAT